VAPGTCGPGGQLLNLAPHAACVISVWCVRFDRRKGYDVCGLQAGAYARSEGVAGIPSEHISPYRAQLSPATLLNATFNVPRATNPV
jgi:hypothetical protein